MQTQQWGIFELELQGPTEGNPFVEVDLSATFSLGHREVRVEGFYDGNGLYRIRFMPDTAGAWDYTTSSNAATLNGAAGSFDCVSADSGSATEKSANRGPVHVTYGTRFAYADGTPYQPVGTTCYVWNHQNVRFPQVPCFQRERTRVLPVRGNSAKSAGLPEAQS